MVKGTVALPVYNSPGIAWLCMESLCRQEKPVDGWELIVFEEVHVTMLGEPFFRSYEPRLFEVGCEKVTYLTQGERLPLSQKWVLMARAADPSSRYYCMCAIDNYYQPLMLRDAERVIEISDWNVTTEGYFYDFNLEKIVKYHYPSGQMIGLQMIALTDKVRDFPMDVKKIGVDSWFASQMGKERNTIDASDHFEKILCTNGLNNISQSRGVMIDNADGPFYPTDKRLEDIVPDCIAYRIKDLTRMMNVRR